MRIMFDVPEDLVNEAMRVTKASTKTELIKTALQQIIQKNSIQALKAYKGKIELDENLDIIRDRDENSGR